MITSLVADSVARWMGILSTGLLVGSEAEAAAVRAQKVLGTQQLGELRRWFGALPPEGLRDAKCAVIEACIAIVHADGVVSDSERELVERMVQLAELDDDAQAWLTRRVDEKPVLDEVVPRLTHPALRELVLVMAWQIVTADGQVEAAEHSAHAQLAEKLGVGAARASVLRTILRDERTSITSPD
jgi:tellurite resistance protein